MSETDPWSGPADEVDALRELAETLAVAGGDLARAMLARLREPAGADPADRRSDGLGVRTKSSATDPVTEVDTAVETHLRTEIARSRPGDVVLGEEEGGADAPPGVVRWVVDPVDGTVNLLYGIPFCAVSVAAQRDGRTLAGAVHVIGTGETFVASVGGGALLRTADGAVTVLAVSSCVDPARALLATGFSYSAAMRAEQGAALAQILPRVRDIRRCGAAAIDLCMVAAGRVDAYAERGLRPWDHAAGALVAAEAGAVVRTSDDDAVATFAAAPGVAETLTAILGEAGVRT